MALKKLSRKKTVGFLLIIVLILLTIVLGIFLYMKYQGGSFSSSNSGQVSSVKENEDLLKKIGKLIILPNGNPDIATVADVNQLSNQTIFRNAKNGDKILIYKDAKRAIVYRPSENIIVEVGSIILDSATPSASIDSDEPEKQVSLAIYNATTTPGYAGRIGNELSTKFSNLEIIDTSNAVGDYETTIVIDLSGENSNIADALAQELGGEVDTLPEGEEEPDSDILIILGQ